MRRSGPVPLLTSGRDVVAARLGGRHAPAARARLPPPGRGTARPAPGRLTCGHCTCASRSLASRTPWAMARAESPALMPMPPLPISVAASSKCDGAPALASMTRCAQAMTPCRTREGDLAAAQLAFLAQADDDDAIRPRRPPRVFRIAPAVEEHLLRADRVGVEPGAEHLVHGATDQRVDHLLGAGQPQRAVVADDQRLPDEAEVAVEHRDAQGGARRTAGVLLGRRRELAVEHAAQRIRRRRLDRAASRRPAAHAGRPAPSRRHRRGRCRQRRCPAAAAWRCRRASAVRGRPRSRSRGPATRRARRSTARCARRAAAPHRASRGRRRRRARSDRPGLLRRFRSPRACTSPCRRPAAAARARAPARCRSSRRAAGRGARRKATAAASTFTGGTPQTYGLSCGSLLPSLFQVRCHQLWARTWARSFAASAFQVSCWSSRSRASSSEVCSWMKPGISAISCRALWSLNGAPSVLRMLPKLSSPGQHRHRRPRAGVRRAEHQQPGAVALHQPLPDLRAFELHGSRHQPAHRMRQQPHRLAGGAAHVQRGFHRLAEPPRLVLDRPAPVVRERDDLVAARRGIRSGRRRPSRSARRAGRRRPSRRCRPAGRARRRCAG